MHCSSVKISSDRVEELPRFVCTPNRNDVIRLDKRVSLFLFCFVLFFLLLKNKTWMKKKQNSSSRFSEMTYTIIPALPYRLFYLSVPLHPVKQNVIIGVPCQILLNVPSHMALATLFFFQCRRTLLPFCSRHQLNVLKWYSSKLQLKHFLLSVNTKIALKAVI